MNQEAWSQQLLSTHFYLNVTIDPYNKRLRVDDYRGDFSAISQRVEKMVIDYHGEKLIFLGRREHLPLFFENGFQCEAMVDQFFHGATAYFLTKYYDNSRKQSIDWIHEEEIVKKVSALNRSQDLKEASKEYQLIAVTSADAERLSELYRNVFPLYPTPLHNPTYVRKTMEKETIYYAFEHEGKIVSAASAEINSFYYNAELTDCATLTSYRQYGLLKILLRELELELKKRSIFCAYSIARAQSFGMNAALYQLGYHYRGRLTNNCYIFDKLEDMNMWVKDLSKG